MTIKEKFENGIEHVKDGFNYMLPIAGNAIGTTAGAMKDATVFTAEKLGDATVATFNGVKATPGYIADKIDDLEDTTKAVGLGLASAALVGGMTLGLPVSPLKKVEAAAPAPIVKTEKVEVKELTDLVKESHSHEHTHEIKELATPKPETKPLRERGKLGKKGYNAKEAEPFNPANFGFENLKPGYDLAQQSLTKAEKLNINIVHETNRMKVRPWGEIVSEGIRGGYSLFTLIDNESYSRGRGNFVRGGSHYGGRGSGNIRDLERSAERITENGITVHNLKKIREQAQGNIADIRADKRELSADRFALQQAQVELAADPTNKNLLKAYSELYVDLEGEISDANNEYGGNLRTKSGRGLIGRGSHSGSGYRGGNFTR